LLISAVVGTKNEELRGDKDANIDRRNIEDFLRMETAGKGIKQKGESRRELETISVGEGYRKRAINGCRRGRNLCLLEREKESEETS